MASGSANPEDGGLSWGAISKTISNLLGGLNNEGPSSDDAEDSSEARQLSLAAKRFAEAQQLSAQAHLEGVIEALSPLEAALLALRSAIQRVDHKALGKLLSESGALLQQMRQELAGPPFRAPARAVLKSARKSGRLLNAYKPALRQIDEIMPRVWGCVAIVDGLRNLLAEVDRALAAEEASAQTKKRTGLFSKASGKSDAAQQLQAMSTNLQLLITKLQARRGPRSHALEPPRLRRSCSPSL